MTPRGKRLLAPLQAADAEDLADEIEVLAGGVMDQRLPEVEELVGLHRAELVADDVAEGARLAARGGLPDARLGERRQDIQLVERHGLWDPPRQKAGSSNPIERADVYSRQSACHW